MATRRMLIAGRYRLREPVGVGGMGRVWKARDEMLDRDVAVKEFVPPDWMTDREKERLTERTLREARSAARLNHPHAVSIYDVVHGDGLPWIVMEYVPSRSLHQVITEDGPVDPLTAARIGLDLLDALTAAHRAGVLHRDVKPHNVLIEPRGRVVLTDFGLATFIDDGAVTGPGLIVGSPQYVSPERARDGASTVESDLWSLGATLYAAVEGRSPYARESAMATLTALATEPPDPPVRAGPLSTALAGLLRRDPAERLTADAVEELLRAVVERTPPSATPHWEKRPGALRRAVRALAPPQRETTTVPGEERGDQASPDLLRVPRVKSGTNRPAVYFKGIVDAPAGRDLLGRTSMVETLSELLLEGELSVGAAPHSGPQVITIDGPWGSGKTTVMHLVKQRLDSEAGAWERRERRSLPIGGRVAELWHARRVTPAGILLTMWLGRRHTSVRDRAAGHSHSARTRAAPARKPPVTTILEPWAHQTSEQFWAALAKAVNQAAVPATFHYRNAQRRFWFRRNAERLDATSLRRALWRSLMSPLLRVAVIALAIPVAVQFLREDDAWTGYGQSADVWAIAVPAVLIGLGVLHTAARFLFGKASRFLPEEIFVSPVLSGALSASSPDPNLRDPLHHSQSGSLYLVQHDVRTVLDTLCTTGRELVIFVDDLDRCGPQVAMEALQALNLFLSGTLRGCRVVIGLDQEIVASQIEEFYRHVESARSSTPTDDPSPGWSFLRKLSHLPVVLPAVGESTLDMFLTEMLGEVEADVEKPILREVTTVLSPGVTRRHAELTARLDPVPAVPSQQMRSAPAERRAASARAVRQMPKALPIPDLHLYTLERHPEVRALMRQRIGAREELSGREIKRLINTWTFYGRILLRKMPTMTLEGAIRSSKALVILAEMLTRWPALARPLTAISNGELGIVTLSRNCGDYVSWHRALATSRLDRACHTKALKSLREVLLECDRDELEAVAIRLFHPRPG